MRDVRTDSGGVRDGIEVLKARLKNLPTTPGVYRMLNAAGDVLYVGKAKNIRNRVTSYTQPERMIARIRKMVFETRDLVVVETRTEAEALLLEANLIKSLNPRYNVLFKDDASYVSVLITDDETPLIRSHRGARQPAGKGGGEYFGPYPSAMAVYQTLELMERAFRLRTCSDGVFRHRTRPCLKYDIKRCSAPCVGKISPADYAQTVTAAKRFLRGQRQAVLNEMQGEMQAASDAMNYEAAAALRDRIKAISAVVGVSTALSHALDEADVFALVTQGGRLAVQAFYYRNGQHVGNHMFYPRHLDEGTEDLAEAMRLFLALHYTTRVAPPYVYCNVAPNDAEALEEALGLAAGRRIRLETPQRGDKRRIVEQAEHNARQALARKSAESDGWGEQVQAFGALLGLERPVEVIECYDISNISGRLPVASLVAAGPDGMLKQRYRRYHIRSKSTPDDYAMMAEVLGRRITRGLKDGGLPTVVMVDGGKGQLGVLQRVAEETGLVGLMGSAQDGDHGGQVAPVLCAIAKGEERDKGLETIFRATWSEGVGDMPGQWLVEQLPVVHGSALIFLLQRIRDEAHRFAITFHREKRSKEIERSVLDGIPGIGPRKKKALLLHFGSARGVEGADVEALAKVPGISRPLAQVIYDYFRAL